MKKMCSVRMGSFGMKIGYAFWASWWNRVHLLLLLLQIFNRVFPKLLLTRVVLDKDYYINGQNTQLNMDFNIVAKEEKI